MKWLLAVFSVLFCVSVIWKVIIYEQGKTLHDLDGLNPIGVFVAEVLAVVIAIIVLIGALFPLVGSLT